jgi:hypothetical protein
MLQTSFDTIGHWRVGERLYARQLAAARAQADRLGQARALDNLGVAPDGNSKSEEATRRYKQALAIVYKLGNAWSRRISCITWGRLPPAKAGGTRRRATTSRRWRSWMRLARMMMPLLSEPILRLSSQETKRTTSPRRRVRWLPRKEALNFRLSRSLHQRPLSPLMLLSVLAEVGGLFGRRN